MKGSQSSPQQPAEEEQEKYSGVAFRPTPWLRSVSAKVFGVLVLISLFNLSVATGLALAVNQAVLGRFISPTDLHIVQQDLVAAGIFMAILTLLISAGVAWLLARHFTKPIKELMMGMERVFHNDLDARVTARRRDELGSLTTFFNSLVEKLRETNERQKAISKLKSEFVSVAAHQLRTPLTGLKWSLQWLVKEKGGPLTDKQRQTIQQQFQATDEMIALVNELLNVAEVEEGKFHYTLQKVDIGRLVTELVERLTPAAQAHQLTLTLDQHIRKGVAVIGDPGHLRLALANLLDNAMRYTKADGAIQVKLLQKKEWVVIEVSDTGIGIPKEEQEKLFSRFFRGHSAQRLQPSGSGLGLFIVQNVIRGHGGKVSVSSKEGQGTTFTVTLPVRSEHVPKESLPEGIAMI